MPITPQQLLRPAKQRPAPRLNLGAPVAANISTQFLDTAQKALSASNARKAKEEKARLDLNNTMLKNDLDTQRVIAEAELADKKGIDSVESVVKIKDNFLRRAKERLDKVPGRFKSSPEIQQSMFQSAGKFDRYAIGYTSSESRKVSDDAYKSRIANDMNDAVDNAANVPYLASQGIGQVETAIIKDLERTYGSNHDRVLPSGITVGGVIDAQVNAGVSETIRKSIQQQLNVNDTDAASRTLNSLNDRILPADRVPIKKMIDAHKKKFKDTRALAIADEADKLSKGDEAMAFEIARVRSGDDAALYSKVTQIISGKAAVKARQKKKNIETNYTGAYNKFIKTAEIDSPEYRALPQEEKDKLVESLNKNRGGPAILTDQKEKGRIELEVENMTDSDFAAVNVREAYGPYLGNKDMELIEAQQRYVKKQINSEYAHGQKWNNAIPKSVAASFSESLALNAEDEAKFGRDVNEMYAQLKQENPKMNETELRRKLTSMVNDKVLTNRDTSFWLNPFSNFEDVYEVPEEGILDSGRDSAQIRRIQSLRLRNGQRPYTEDQLDRLLSRP